MEYVPYQTDEYKRRCEEFKEKLKEKIENAQHVNVLGCDLMKLEMTLVPSDIIGRYDFKTKQYLYPKL